MVETIIREVCPNVWTFSRPFSRFGIMPIGGRSTAVKLSNGDVWVMASTPLDEPTKETLARMGTVKYIIGADSVHHLYLGEFQKAYPDAKLIAVEEAVNKKKEEKLNWAGWWADNDREKTFGFEDEIKSCYFSGFKNKDMAFLHQPSKTLIQADLMFNMPATEQYSKSWFSGRLPFGLGDLTPFSGGHRSLSKRMGVDVEAMKRDCKTVAAWDFERMIPCHGDVLEKDGNKAFRSCFADFLE